MAGQPIPLGPEDRAILSLESATVAGHSCKLLRLGPGAPSVDALRSLVAERVRLVPALTWRLGGSLSAPAWVPDPGFDVARHVVEHQHQGAVRAADLRACVARLFEQRLDRRRPLWQMDVIELEGGEQAIVWRIHHALADGTTAVRYARELLWDSVRGRAETRSQTITRHAADEARRRAHLAGYLRREFRRSRSRSPFDGPIGTERRIGLATVPLAPLHDAVKALDGATLNDAVLTIVAGSVRHWLRSHHIRVNAIRAKVPVSLHHEGDQAANHDSSFSLALPLGETDPVTRLHLIQARTRPRKSAGDAEERELLLGTLSSISPRLERAAVALEQDPRRFALGVSNVPGPRQPVKILTSPVRCLHSLAEISERHALRISIISFVDQVCFGFCADAEVVPDVQLMADRVEPEAMALINAIAYC